MAFPSEESLRVQGNRKLDGYEQSHLRLPLNLTLHHAVIAALALSLDMLSYDLYFGWHNEVT